MTSRIITDISNFIFISDTPEKADAIFLPGGSHPEQPEYAAELYKKGFAKWLIPSGGVSVKRDKWPGVRSKADIYDKDYKTDCEFFTDVLTKNDVPSEAIFGEDKSGHTRDNAFFSRKAVDEKGIEIKIVPNPVFWDEPTKEDIEKGTFEAAEPAEPEPEELQPEQSEEVKEEEADGNKDD